MEAPRDALDETRYGDGHVLSELPVKYPEFVVERFITRPLANVRSFQHRRYRNELAYQDPYARVEVGSLQQRRHVCRRVVKKIARGQVLIRHTEEAVAHYEEDGTEQSSPLARLCLRRLRYDGSRVEVHLTVEQLAALLGRRLLLSRDSL